MSIGSVFGAIGNFIAPAVKPFSPAAANLLAYTPADVAGVDAGATAFTAQVATAVAPATVWVVQGVSKEGAITNFVQEYVPGGGFVTAIAHAAAGNEDYAQLAAIKGLSTTITTGAGIAGQVLGGPAGAILAAGLGDAAANAIEGALKTTLAPSVQGHFQDLSIENVAIAGATGAAGAALGFGLGKAVGKAAQGVANKIGPEAEGVLGKVGKKAASKANKAGYETDIVLTRPRAGGILAAPTATGWLTGAQFRLLGPYKPPTPKNIAKALAKKTGLKGGKKAGQGGLEEAASELTGLEVDFSLDQDPSPDLTASLLAGVDDWQAKLKRVIWAGIATVLLVGGGAAIIATETSDQAPPKALAPTTLATAASIVTTVATTTVPTVPSTNATATTGAVVALITATTTKTTTKPTTTPPTTTPTTTTPPTTVGATAPGAPTGVSATTGTCSATVSFTPPANSGGIPITGYTVIGSPSGSGSGSSSPIVVTVAANWPAFTFTVQATNAVGTGSASSPSNSIFIEGCA